MRMIHELTRFIAILVFGRTDLMVDMPSLNKADSAQVPPYVILYLDIIKMADSGEINAAEDKLFSQADIEDMGFLEAGLAFYSHLSEMDDEVLERCNYSREEILDGIKALSDLFGIEGTEEFDG